MSHNDLCTVYYLLSILNDYEIVCLHNEATDSIKIRVDKWNIKKGNSVNICIQRRMHINGEIFCFWCIWIFLVVLFHIHFCNVCNAKDQFIFFNHKYFFNFAMKTITIKVKIKSKITNIGTKLDSLNVIFLKSTFSFKKSQLLEKAFL